MHPWDLKIGFQLFRSEMHLVPTLRGAVIQMNWEEQTLRRFCLNHAEKEAKIEIDPILRTVFGYTTAPTHDAS